MSGAPESLSLFGSPESEFKARLREQLRRYAQQKIFLGTSSWKYEGWLGQIYSRERYTTRGRFSKKRFEQECLAEYAETFPTVCGDFAFYQFPTLEFWRRLFENSSAQLSSSFKVPEEITTPAFPSHPRYGPRSGTTNSTFLDRALFEDLFLQPLTPYQNRVPLLILEFGAICGTTFKAEDFTARVGQFLDGLPQQFRYAVEIRNEEFLHFPDYLEMLRAHRVAHVFNAWSKMPTLREQIQTRDIFTTDITVVRALLTHGRPYEDAVRRFSPYEQIEERNPDVREAIRDILIRTERRGEAAYIYVNNRLEGNAPTTIHEILEEAEAQENS